MGKRLDGPARFPAKLTLPKRKRAPCRAPAPRMNRAAAGLEERRVLEDNTPHLDTPPAPVVVSYGGGTNSTALLIGMVERGEPVDLILFADTGGERPDTYEYVRRFSKWLAARDYPSITVVWSVTKNGDRLTLEQRSLGRGMLPSKAYGYSKCSLRFKRDPQDKFVNNWPPAQGRWRNGGKVVKAIGFDADEPGRASRMRSVVDPKYLYVYPLIEWQWGREECEEVIRRAGLPQPGKSSCFFCPSMKPPEILALARCYPDLAARALALEDAARPGLKGTMRGLGRDWAWSDFLKADRLQQKMFKQPMSEACACFDGWNDPAEDRRRLAALLPVVR